MKKILFVLVLFLCFSCRTDESPRPVFPDGTTESVNLWVKDQMEKYYYWHTAIPKNPDYSLPTPQFLKSILSPEDRFSFIVDKNNPSTYPRSVRNLFGFDYAVLKLNNNKVVTVIKLVLHNSPAANVGLKRGMIITKLNGVALTASNAETLTKSLSNFNTLALTVGEWQNDTVVKEKELTIYHGLTFNQPLLSKIFERNGKKVGYLYIHNLQEGMTHSFIQKFAEFKAEGIKELILDLRYNFGGSVASATALCAMVPIGITPDKPFIKYIGNKNGGTIYKTFAEQIAYDASAPSFSSLQANALNLNRVYVLTSNNTASAAEIVINNLRPYTNVIQVGTKTLGKDMAGFPIKDVSKPQKISWEIHPVIYKVYNANGDGEYPNGLTPQLEASEFNTLPLFQLGNPEETLLSIVLGKAFAKKTRTDALSIYVSEVLIESQNLDIEIDKKNDY